ncbi:helix-turn-helix domain-containing protein [Paenibacillus brasilensis]|uniref:DNA-binding transcriptional MerR regulator n=1 Tax=Paenibacillus brasilensis TaxID=128574 RepID=A0ABU0KTI2_9BACL|nr:helix-turn-helix domain-containing protein [Paenibacillus brasilensis]MDQ0492752.1 DNA-binding transcriptional MerR regulator [Paenibacillus brasilensis]
MYSFKDKDELLAWIQSELVSANEAMEILDCSRQNLHSFVKRGKLVPVKETNRERLFLRDDVLERKDEASIYNRKK